MWRFGEDCRIWRSRDVEIWRGFRNLEIFRCGDLERIRNLEISRCGDLQKIWRSPALAPQFTCVRNRGLEPIPTLGPKPALFERFAPLALRIHVSFGLTFGLLASRHLQRSQPLRDVHTSCRGLDALVDVENSSIRPDVKRPARCEAHHAEHTIGSGSFFRGIGEDRIVGADMLGEFLVRLGVVHARREVGDVECANRVAALTERLAFRRSSACKRFGKPRQHHGALAFEIRERVRLAV
jgi:hypothetical protein